jgi:UDP-N-acetylmuramate dehydrogenase
MKIYRNYSLKEQNTFGMDAKASSYAEVVDLNDVTKILDIANRLQLPVLVLGSGSNLLLTKDVDGLVIHPTNKGIRIVNETELYVDVEAMAGEEWDNLVAWAVKNNFGGIENLSYIPGTVGSSPVQNIGAYGTELKDVFQSLKAIELANNQLHDFDYDKCEFAYRHSFFKQSGKNSYMIWSVVLRLNKNPKPNVSYPALIQSLAAVDVDLINIKIIRDKIISIRKKKLPEVGEIGSAGSFFKNPVISIAKYEELKAKYEAIPFYDVEEGKKIPAGWLIEKCGFKGYRAGDAGVWPQQALVLVNYAEATGLQILDLCNNIVDSVMNTFGVQLEPEVQIL